MHVVEEFCWKMYFMKSVWNTPDFRAERRKTRVVVTLPSAHPFLASHALLSSCEYEILPEGCSIAEREYKNRINRVYDVAKGEGNAAKANRF